MSNQKTMGEWGGGGGGEKTLRKTACIQPLLSQDWKGRFRPLYIMQHVLEQFSEAKPLSIIRAFKWYFSGKLGIFSQRKYNSETILKGNDY